MKSDASAVLYVADGIRRATVALAGATIAPEEKEVLLSMIDKLRLDLARCVEPEKETEGVLEDRS